MERFQHIRVNFERKTEAPIYWKRQQLEVLKGVVGVEFGAPEACASELAQRHLRI